MVESTGVAHVEQSVQGSRPEALHVSSMHGYSAVAVAVAVTEAEGVGDATGERLGVGEPDPLIVAVAEGVKVGCAGAKATPRNCAPGGAVGSGDGEHGEAKEHEADT